MVKAELKKAWVQYEEAKQKYQKLELPQSRYDYV
jgi:hypothetical protein